MKLVRLIYASRVHEPLGKADVGQILASSQRHNAALAVTGYLCVSPAYVMQCLEGPRAAVNGLYNLIAADRRHREVTLLRYVEPWRRLFPVWDMGFSPDLSVAAPDSRRWYDAGGFNPFLVESDLIENTIEALCEQTERVELRA